jgi:hypothetical protein
VAVRGRRSFEWCLVDLEEDGGTQFELQIGEYYKADLRDHGRLRGIEQKDIYKKRKNLV